MRPLRVSIKAAYSIAMAAFLMAALCIAVQPALAGQNPLAEARERLSRGDHSGALRALNTAYRKQPYVRDYILYHSAEARLAIAEPEKAIEALEELLNKYPGSPIRQKARQLEVRIILSGDWDKAVPLLQSYLSEYPSDDEIRFSLAEKLVMRGRAADAGPHLKRLYISSGQYAEKALALWEEHALSPDESFERAGNLMALRKHELAEPLLRELLSSIISNTSTAALAASNQSRLVNMLGHALFYQKKYDECPPYLIEAGDYYDAARSYLRSGNLTAFTNTVEQMLVRKDKDTPKLLYSLGEEARRKGNLSEALSHFDRAIAAFPEDSEDARWGKGWLYYTSGDYERAAAEFEALAKLLQDSRYPYWWARSLQRLGKDPSPALTTVKPDGYYGLLARLRSNAPIEPLTLPPLPSGEPNRLLRRAEILANAGFAEDAGIELQSVSTRTKNISDLVDISMLLVRAGRYNDAVRILNRVPSSMRPEDAAYPLAFWETVTNASLSHGLDPFLLLSLMKEESQFATDALSSAGAVGLMQLMPTTAAQTARKLGMEIGGEAILNTPETNIRIGAGFYGELFTEFEHVPASLAAYNAGRTPVRKWLSKGYSSADEFVEDIPYKETREYVKRILSTYHRYLSGRGQSQSPALSKIL